MLRRIIPAIIFSLIVAPVFSQTIEIRGLLIDKITGQPVSEAHVTSSTGKVAVTDGSGHFTLSIPGIPETIHITHVSYGILQYPVTKKPVGPLVILISPAVTTLDEVQISGERMRILTKKDQFSVQEFVIEEGVIWFLGFINNQAGLQRLFLANLYGDTLASIPVKQADKLYHDVFHAVHIVFKDTVYQLYHTEGNQIEFLYPMATEPFFSLMGEIELAIDQKLIYSKALNGRSSRCVYYVQKDDPVRYQLAVLQDTIEAGQQRVAQKMDPLMVYWNIPELENMWTSIYRYNKRGTRFDKVINRPVPYEVFQANNDLFIINFFKDSLLVFAADGKFKQAIPIDFHKETSADGVMYKKLTCLTDPVTQKVFVLEKHLSSWALSALNTTAGKTEQPVHLPDFPGMDGLCVYDNAVYFTYQEKVHPYYNRLYRYQL
ncbi:MAG: hypothetical protein WC699_13920 [Bacteroidales bacterium]|jgi:hypothetical protein